jgi:WD40 repeat protein
VLWAGVVFLGLAALLVGTAILARHVLLFRASEQNNSVAQNPEGKVQPTQTPNEVVAKLPQDSIETKKSELSEVKSKPKQGIPEIRLIDRLIGHPSRTSVISHSSDGHRIVTGDTDECVHLWDNESEKELHRFNGHTASVTSVAISNDRHRILSGSQDKTVLLWNADNGQLIHKLGGHDDTVNCVAFSPVGDRALTTGNGRIVRLWDLTTGKEVRRFDHPKGVTCVSFSPDRKQFLAGVGSGFNRDDNTLHLWDVETGIELKRFNGHRHYVWSVAISPDGTHALSGSFDKTVRLWDLRTGAEVRRFERKGFVKKVVFLRGGLRLLFSHDRVIAYLDLDKSGTAEIAFADNINAFAVSPSGDRLLVSLGNLGVVLRLSVP